MNKIQAPKGTQDILPADAWKWQAVERIARDVAELYHFTEIRTPIFEHSELFHRGVGETTDIVSKETYTFNDRDNRSLTLRPEGTAGVVRAVIEAGLLNDEGSRAKVFYLGPNFRYERPQKGRYRQHHQFGVEAFGISEPEQDAECIQLQMDFYRRCGVKDPLLRVNSLGDAESKSRFRDALIAFLEPKKHLLSEDSARRLAQNPLRILDSKDPRDIDARLTAPVSLSCLSPSSWKRFERLLKALSEAQIPHVVDTNLVRGLDYYTDTVWEVVATGLGAQNSLGGGGRYDNLVETIGGYPTPGVGFGSGLERLLIALEAQGVALAKSAKPLVWLIAHGDAARDANSQLMRELRSAGIPADMDVSGRSVKSQFKLADREGASVCLVTGENELAAKTVVMKNLATREETTVPRDEIVGRLTPHVSS